MPEAPDEVSAATVRALVDDPSAVFARYQPVVDLASGRVVAHAASVYARLGNRLLEPQALFALARTDEALIALDVVARRTALQGAAGWLEDRLLVLRLVADVVADPRAALAGLADDAAASGVPARQIIVEVGFAAGRDALSQLARVVTHCRGIGCGVAVADVPDAATMRSSAALLAPDVVRPGRWLLDGSAAREARATVQAVHDAGSRVVAFGIESDADVEHATALGADWGQGWFLGRPTEPRSP